MGLPSKRRTKTSQRDRRSHFALKTTHTRVCENCKAPALPHRACASCGFYRGRKVTK